MAPGMEISTILTIIDLEADKERSRAEFASQRIV